jgi:DNA replication initiation complex subunit (GINS family)
MTREGSSYSNDGRAQQISSELAGLFQQQIELTRQEALVGLTPAECELYDKIVERIRASYIELAKLRPDP